MAKRITRDTPASRLLVTTATDITQTTATTLLERRCNTDSAPLAASAYKSSIAECIIVVFCTGQLYKQLYKQPILHRLYKHSSRMNRTIRYTPATTLSTTLLVTDNVIDNVIDNNGCILPSAINAPWPTAVCILLRSER